MVEAEVILVILHGVQETLMISPIQLNFFVPHPLPFPSYSSFYS
jgi:hypothetical protein